MPFGVRIVVCGRRSSRSACDHVVGRELVAAAGREHRVENQRHVGIVGNDLGDRRDDLDAAQNADLERVDRHVFEEASRLVVTHSASSAWTPSTPIVSCTVIAVTTDSGWQPMLASVRMSACKPAPPDGSVAAKVRTRGGNSGSVSEGIGAGAATRNATVAQRGGGLLELGDFTPTSSLR